MFTFYRIQSIIYKSRFHMMATLPLKWLKELVKKKITDALEFITLRSHPSTKNFLRVIQQKKLSNTLNVLCILLLTLITLSALGHWAWIEHAYDEHDSSTFLCTFKLLLVFRACISLFLMLTLNKSLPEVTASASVKSINFRFNILLLGQKVISHPLCQNLDMRKLLVILVILK